MSEPIKHCRWWQHKWTRWGQPKQVETTYSVQVAQRSECVACGAVDYRKVRLHG